MAAAIAIGDRLVISMEVIIAGTTHCDSNMAK
jgi:hypothetical protein